MKEKERKSGKQEKQKWKNFSIEIKESLRKEGKRIKLYQGNLLKKSNDQMCPTRKVKNKDNNL